MYVSMIIKTDHYPVCSTFYCKVPKAKTAKHKTVKYGSNQFLSKAGAFLSDLSKCPFDTIYGLPIRRKNQPISTKCSHQSMTSMFLIGQSVLKETFFFNLSLSPCLTSYSQKAMKRRDKIKKEKDYPEFKETKKTCEVFSKAGEKGFFCG